VFYNLEGYSSPKNAVSSSEGHGYGMLLTAIMAGYDPLAKTYFDGLYRFFKAHPSVNHPNLMAWQQIGKGSDIVDTPEGGNDSATDGDMDIAYALLLANKQWGSGGGINYMAEAKKVIGAIMAKEVNSEEKILKLGDWVDNTDPKYGKATRPSDFMLNHMKVFKAVSGDASWRGIVDQTYGMIQYLYQSFSPQTGLLPDFSRKDAETGNYKPAPAEFLEGTTDGLYSWNACRTPWRIATDYILTGDDRAKAQLQKLNDWIRKTTAGNPEKIAAGYTLDGKPLETYSNTAFTAPFTVSAMIDSSNQEWLNRLWTYNVSQSTKDGAYFGNSIRLICLLVVSGNWWTPVIS
jgi:endo-1,4-beta-D-glucanase Y